MSILRKFLPFSKTRLIMSYRVFYGCTINEKILIKVFKYFIVHRFYWNLLFIPHSYHYLLFFEYLWLERYSNPRVFCKFTSTQIYHTVLNIVVCTARLLILENCSLIVLRKVLCSIHSKYSQHEYRFKKKFISLEQKFNWQSVQ